MKNNNIDLNKEILQNDGILNDKETFKQYSEDIANNIHNKEVLYDEYKSIMMNIGSGRVVKTKQLDLILSDLEDKLGITSFKSLPEQFKYIRNFSAVNKVKSLSRAIRRGKVSITGELIPKRPFNNRKNRKNNELKKREYFNARFLQ